MDMGMAASLRKKERCSLLASMHTHYLLVEKAIPLKEGICSFAPCKTHNPHYIVFKCGLLVDILQMQALRSVC